MKYALGATVVLFLLLVLFVLGAVVPAIVQMILQVKP